MTVELTMLVFSVGLLLVILLVQGALGVLSNGLAAQAGPRDGLPDPGVEVDVAEAGIAEPA